MKSASKIALLACSLMSSVAHAGTPEALSQITPRPAGSKVVGLASVHGKQNLMYSKDGGKSFALLCMSMTNTPYVDADGDDAVKNAGSFEPGIITHDGRFLVGSFSGLWTDDGSGCDWQLVDELGDTYVTALAYDPHDPRIIYGITARGGQDNGLFRRDADGGIERLGVQEPVLFRSMRLAPLSDGGIRVYATNVREQVLVMPQADGSVAIFDPDAGTPRDDAGAPLPNVGTEPFFVLRYSDDFGTTWTQHDIGVLHGAEPTIEAIDPSDPDRIVLAYRLDAEQGGSAVPDQLVVSDDRGETLTPWLEVSAISGVSIAKDGTVFVGDRGEGRSNDPQGLWRARSLSDEPQQIADYDVWCVDAREDRLEICTYQGWGTVDPDTGAFTELFSAKKFEAIHSCGGEDNIALCHPDVCVENCAHWLDAPACKEHYPECAAYADGYTEGGQVADAGLDAGPDAGSAAASKSDGGGCRVASADSRRAWPGGLLSAALAALFVIRRTRRTKRVSAAPRDTAA